MNKILISIIAVLIIAIGGIIGYFVTETKTEKTTPQDLTFIDLGEYITNTQDNRYIKANIYAETNEELTEKKEIVVKDKIIQVLSSKEAMDLISPQGKEELKEDIKNTISPILKTKRILFNNFVIQ